MDSRLCRHNEDTVAVADSNCPECLKGAWSSKIAVKPKKTPVKTKHLTKLKKALEDVAEVEDMDIPDPFNAVTIHSKHYRALIDTTRKATKLVEGL